MIRILFICHGNICRSPMAEFVLKDMVQQRGLADEFYIESAATSTEEIWNGIGNPVYPPARKIMAEHGISCEGKRARQITVQDFETFDYIIGMDSENLRNMKRICPQQYQDKISLMLDYTDHPRSVSDPWYTGDFEATWRDVNDGCQGLLRHLGY
ncbi:low molecular weight protein-tyrosine-phosphatase [Butyrivibrio sp.]|uniref:low molecular weight protein-tyrosine-phosphatase n=1 Tax=Butyrivibrio sp. TaxID=28121 RepID=UPI0025C07787|nr:low molecular weight protein-tyrosine-phosphatase [Butyrivibrio sp.]MBQ7431251.1 low molecular weight phosphotyrosine protein phosphatase [Butyrivibrio sp.]MBQ9302160.1 low molecular weight phosphotyrosine protein phosphatase [Butyrivibrio sp.]